MKYNTAAWSSTRVRKGKLSGGMLTDEMASNIFNFQDAAKSTYRVSKTAIDVIRTSNKMYRDPRKPLR